MDKLKELWEDPKKRNIIIAIPAVAILYFLITFMSDKSKEDIARKSARHAAPSESIQVFSTQGMDELDKQEVEQMRIDLANDADESNRAIELERKAMDKKQEETAKHIVVLQRQMAETNKMINAFMNTKKRNKSKKSKGQHNETEELQDEQVYAQQNQQQSGNVVNKQQTTILTRNLSAIEGKAIRTVTQRQIRSVKSTGDIAVEERTGSVLSQAKEKRKASAKTRPQETVKAKEFFLPSGSIISGTLLNGVDAPTSTASANDPMPILLRIKREAILPNHFTMDVRECHMLASAVGELSSERVRMRAEAISCILNDGRAIEKNITAYAVSSYDGKVGVRGRLVSRNGQAIARAMMAGFMSGMADAAGPKQIQGLNTSNDGQSLWQSSNPTDIVGSGAFNGASKAMDRLAEYYTEMAENMYPIIELSPGTQVDFIVQKGMSFKLELPQGG